MSWKVGDVAALRSGKKARIISVMSEPLWNGHTIIATVEGRLWTYHSDGAVQLGIHTLDDLIGDDPIVRTMYVNVYMTRSGNFHEDPDGLIGRAYTTRNAADKAGVIAGQYRVACVEVVFEEGEGV